ncbi:MAG: DUF2079 domain-containing protein [Ardenticatenaceae bacterium]
MPKLKHTDLIAILLLFSYAFIFSWLKIAQHHSFGTDALDLAKFDQAIWSTSQGNPFHITLSEDLVIQSHFSPSLALYAPLYWIWPDIRVLLIAQSFLMAGAGFLIYWFFREQKPWLGLGLYAAYLMHPALHQVTITEFRRLTIAVFATSFALYHLLKQNYGWMGLGLVIALLSKEDMAFTAIGIGLYILFLHRSFKVGALSFVIGFMFLLLIPFFVLPALNDGGGYHHAEANFVYLGGSLDEIVQNLSRNPALLFDYSLQQERLAALFRFLWPTLFLFVLAPEIAAFLLPYLAFLLSSTSDNMGQLRLWYPSVLLVFLYWAVAIGLSRLPSKWHKIALSLLLVAGFSSWLLYSPLWPGSNFEAQEFQVSEYDRRIRKVLQQIPTDVAVAAQNAFVPHLSHREQIYLFPWLPSNKKIDYIVLDRSMESYPLGPDEYQSHFYDLAAGAKKGAGNQYEIEYQIDDFYLFRRVEQLEPTVSRQDTWDDAFTLTGYHIAISTTTGPFQRSNLEADASLTARVELFWRVEQAMGQNYSVFVHLLDPQQQIITQHDGWPADGYRPTSALTPGDLVRDIHYLSWPTPQPATAGAKKGSLDGLSLRIGVYDSQAGTSLLLPDGQPFIVVPFAP